MKILWFTGNRKKQQNTSYGGGGWISSLTEELRKNKDITLAKAFFYDYDDAPYYDNGIWEYPMYKKEKSKLKKIVHYWTKNNQTETKENIGLMQKVINDFKPDIIQVFGLESPFCPILNYTKIPTIIYLQGIVNPISNAFYPNGINKYSFLFSRFSKREWIYRNGIAYLHKNMKLRAKIEIEILKKSTYLIGRTKFDHEISDFFAPNANYYHLNEMMKNVFYSSTIWKKTSPKKYVIYTTISNVTYKGLDTILKTAQILINNDKTDFEWHIAGITPQSELVLFFEKILKIKSGSVNIIYDGIVPADKLVEKLRNADVFVHTSYIDNSPNSVCEAQLVGLPVVACYVGGVSDFVITGETGELIPANAPYELACILKKDMEKPYLYQYSEKARKIALERHDKKRIVDTLLNIYNSILIR